MCVKVAAEKFNVERLPLNEAYLGMWSSLISALCAVSRSTADSRDSIKQNKDIPQGTSAAALLSICIDLRLKRRIP